MMVREMTVTEKPINRMLEYGAMAISNAELLSIIIGENGKTDSLDMGHTILKHNGLNDLRNSIPEIEQLEGMTKTRTARLMAALELGNRIAVYNTAHRTIVSCPDDVAEYAMPRLKNETREHFAIIILNVKNHIMSMPIISIGSMTASIIHPREVFNVAIKQNAAAIILVHNHPSGDPTPSNEDIATTKRLIEVGKLTDIPVLDHVIIGNNQYVSMKEKGIIK